MRAVGRASCACQRLGPASNSIAFIHLTPQPQLRVAGPSRLAQLPPSPPPRPLSRPCRRHLHTSSSSSSSSLPSKRPDDAPTRRSSATVQRHDLSAEAKRGEPRDLPGAGEPKWTFRPERVQSPTTSRPTGSSYEQLLARRNAQKSGTGDQPLAWEASISPADGRPVDLDQPIPLTEDADIGSVDDASRGKDPSGPKLKPKPKPSERWKETASTQNTEDLRRFIKSKSSDYRASLSDLDYMFSHTRALDQATFTLAARILITSIISDKAITPDVSVRWVGKCLREMYYKNLLVATQPVLTCFLGGIDRTMRSGSGFCTTTGTSNSTSTDISPKTLAGWYLPLLDLILSFRTFSHTADTLLRDQVSRILSHYVDHLNTLPGRSLTRHPIDDSILNKVLHRNLISAEVRKLVIVQASRSGVPLSRAHRDLCMEGAVREGNHLDVQEYMGSSGPQDEMTTAQTLKQELKAELEEDIDENVSGDRGNEDDGPLPKEQSEPDWPSRGRISWKDRTSMSTPKPPGIPKRSVVQQSNPDFGQFTKEGGDDDPSSSETEVARSGTEPGSHKITAALRDAVTPEAWSPEILDKARLLMAQKTLDIDALYAVAGDHLASPYETSSVTPTSEQIKTHRLAWNKFCHGIASVPNTTVDDLVGIYNMMPDSAMCAGTVTPLIHGLNSRGGHRHAWRLWLAHLQYAASAPLDTTGQFIDPHILFEASRACAKLMGLSKQVEFIDYWAKRPNRLRRVPSDASDDDEQHQEGSDTVTDLNPRDRFEHSVVIDAYNVNAMLMTCRQVRSPSVALRIWSAASPRWGSPVDEASLQILLDCTRFYESGRLSGARSGGVGDSSPSFGEGGGGGGRPPRNGISAMRHELRMFFAQLSQEKLFHSVHDDDLTHLNDDRYDAYEADGFSKGGPGVLLDPPMFKWHTEHGVVRPWQVSRSIFRQVVLGNWPHLRGIPNPLDPIIVPESSQSGGWFSRYFADRSRPPVPSTRAHPSYDEPDPGRDLESDMDQAGGPELDLSLIDTLPVLTARYMHLIPDADTWQSYIHLLGFVGLTPQIPLTFAWMRALSIRPTWFSMCMGLAYIREDQGEPKRVRIRTGMQTGHWKYATNEEVMRDYLVDWLGAGTEEPGERRGSIKNHYRRSPDGVGRDGQRKVVPTPADVVATRMWYMGENLKFRSNE